MEYLLGIDLGTSGTKTVLFTKEGQTVASKTIEYPLLQPKNGWAEQNPEDWYRACANTVKGVLGESGVNPKDVKALAISGQMHGLVMLDENFRVLRPAILWCDARTQKQCDEIHNKVGKSRLIEITANPALAGFTASKILWVKENEPNIYEKCKHILLPKDYVRFRLTNELYMELSDASGTNLLDIRNRVWSDEIIDALDLDRKMFPPLISSIQNAGTITKEAADDTGLAEGTIVAGGAGDNASAAIGTGVCEDGKAFVTLGTSGVVFAHTSKIGIDPLGRVHTFISAVPNAYTAMSCTLAAGLSLRWMRDEFFSYENEEAKKEGRDVYDFMMSEAAKIPTGSDGLIYLPYLMGERSPVLDPQARGVFFGLSARHTKAHLTLACIEGVTLSQRHNLHVLHELGVKSENLVACGGGARSELWCQMLSDVLKCSVTTLESKEGPALGVAIMAGVACGIFKSIEEGCRICIKTSDKVHTTNKEVASKYDEIYNLYSFLYPTMRPAFAKLANLREKLDGNQISYPSVNSVEFERYGKLIDGIDTAEVLSLMKKTTMPDEGVVYVPSEKELEVEPIFSDIQNRVFGGLPIQIGYCNGHNKSLNCLEYHRNSELNIFDTDTVLLLAPVTAIKDGIVDTESVERFFVPKGSCVLLYETALHFAPCQASGEDFFRVCCVLPRNTNTQRPGDVTYEGESGYLTHNNKWLFAHPSTQEAALTSGRLLGENIVLD